MTNGNYVQRAEFDNLATRVNAAVGNLDRKIETRGSGTPWNDLVEQVYVQTGWTSPIKWRRVPEHTAYIRNKIGGGFVGRQGYFVDTIGYAVGAALLTGAVTYFGLGIFEGNPDPNQVNPSVNSGPSISDWKWTATKWGASIGAITAAAIKTAGQIAEYFRPRNQTENHETIPKLYRPSGLGVITVYGEGLMRVDLGVQKDSVEAEHQTGSYIHPVGEGQEKTESQMIDELPQPISAKWAFSYQIDGKSPESVFKATKIRDDGGNFRGGFRDYAASVFEEVIGKYPLSTVENRNHWAGLANEARRAFVEKDILNLYGVEILEIEIRDMQVADSLKAQREEVRTSKLEEQIRTNMGRAIKAEITALGVNLDELTNRERAEILKSYLWTRNQGDNNARVLDIGDVVASRVTDNN